MDMFNRDDFRDWLGTLPQDEPFCIKECCPLVTYWMILDPNASPGELRNNTLRSDFELVRAIDELTDWHRITPCQVIELIDRTPYRAWPVTPSIDISPRDLQ